MALWELEEFQGPKFLGFVRSVPVDPTYQGSRWLPDLSTFDLTFEYVLGANERPVMAHVMGWDSEAPIAGRPGLGERVQGELPPIKRKAKISEKEILRFLQPRANTPDVQQAIRSVYGLTGNLLDSVQARVEWLKMQALSEDRIVYNEDGVIFNFDYGYDNELQIDMTTETNGNGTALGTVLSTVWSDTAASNPLLDLQYLTDLAEGKTGRRFGEFVCSRKTEGYILNNTNLRNMIRGSTAPAAVLTRAEVDTLFRLYNLPDIVTYDVKVDKENANGTRTQVRTMAENRAFLVPTGGGSILAGHSEVGACLWGPTAEARTLIGTNLASRAPGIMAVTYATEDPPAEWVKAVGVSFPSIPGANLIGQMQVW